MGFLNSTKAGRNGSERTQANNERMYRSAGGKWGMQPVYKSPATSDGLEGIRASNERLRRSGIFDPSIFDNIKMTLQQWVSNVGVWYSNLDKAFDKSNILHYVGLGSWARVGVAAAAAGALAAAYYAWKKWNKKREGENTPMVPANASFMPEFSDYIANEAERFDVAMCTAMTLLTEAVADGVADGQITARVNQMIASIKRDADKAARVLASIAQDQDASKAPPELMEQMAAVASMLEERNAA